MSNLETTRTRLDWGSVVVLVSFCPATADAETSHRPE